MAFPLLFLLLQVHLILLLSLSVLNPLIHSYFFLLNYLFHLNSYHHYRIHLHSFSYSPPLYHDHHYFRDHLWNHPVTPIPPKAYTHRPPPL